MLYYGYKIIENKIEFILISWLFLAILNAEKIVIWILWQFGWEINKNLL